MTKQFQNLVDQMTTQSQERVNRRTVEMSQEMALQELRQALELTQQELAGRLQMNQAAVSKLEHQSDMYISTLRRFLSAMGGELRIIASFAEGDVVISQFEDVRSQKLASPALSRVAEARAIYGTKRPSRTGRTG